MKFLAFILALVVGGLVWFFPAGFAIMIVKNSNLGAFEYGLSFGFITFSLIFLVRFFYKFFVKKFGYEILDEEKKNDK